MRISENDREFGEIWLTLGKPRKRPWEKGSRPWENLNNTPWETSFLFVFLTLGKLDIEKNAYDLEDFLKRPEFPKLRQVLSRGWPWQISRFPAKSIGFRAYIELLGGLSPKCSVLCVYGKRIFVLAERTAEETLKETKNIEHERMLVLWYWTHEREAVHTSTTHPCEVVHRRWM